MSLQDDFNDLRKAWSSFSPLIKVFLAASFFTSSLSIASIADSVFQLKGFILAGIEFYRSLTAPVLSIVYEYFGVKLIQPQVDGIIFAALVFGSIIRSEMLYSIPPSRFRLYYLINFSLVSLFIGNLQEPNAFKVSYVLFLVILISAFIFLLFEQMVGTKIGKYYFQIDKRDIKDGIQLGRIAALNLIGVLLFVAVIAGISEGLTRG